MATKEQEPQQPGLKDEGQPLSAVIGNHVLRALGRPGDLQGVQVRPLWEDRYRVNVLVGRDPASARVVHSFFLVVDGAGNILAATPTVTRRYGPGGEALEHRRV
jgi:hypothetical protein